jgi:uncharacterized protein
MSPSAKAYSTPREVLDKFYESERIYTSAPADERDFTIIAATLSDDFRMEQSRALPWAGLYRGPQQFKDWLDKVAQWVVIDVQNPEIFDSKDADRVVVLSTIHYSCHRTGQKIDFPLSQTFTIDGRKGLIKEIRSYYWDILTLNEAMGYGGQI